MLPALWGHHAGTGGGETSPPKLWRHTGKWRVWARKPPRTGPQRIPKRGAHGTPSGATLPQGRCAAKSMCARVRSRGAGSLQKSLLRTERADDGARSPTPLSTDWISGRSGAAEPGTRPRHIRWRAGAETRHKTRHGAGPHMGPKQKGKQWPQGGRSVEIAHDDISKSSFSRSQRENYGIFGQCQKAANGEPAKPAALSDYSMNMRLNCRVEL